jgi:hypothetical protein
MKNNILSREPKKSVLPELYLAILWTVSVMTPLETCEIRLYSVIVD